jgi:transcriptional regulator with XRE-family HTH domain
MNSAIEKKRRFRREESDSKVSARRFGSYLRDVRRRSGVDIPSLARSTGLTPDYLYKIERGYSPVPATERIIQIAAALGVDRGEMLENANRIEPDIMEAIRGKQTEVTSIIRLFRGYPPSALEYVKERIEMILDELNTKAS